MFQSITAPSADSLWLQAHSWFKPNGICSVSESRNGPTAEVLHAALSLSAPRQRWIGSREPAMNPAFALAEVLWILRGRQDASFLNYFCPGLPRFAGRGSTYHGAYGHRLRHRFGLDQLRQATGALRQNPDSRQILLQIWDAATDLPDASGTPRAEDIPCNVVAMLKVRDGRLEWTQVMRSNDLILGLPHNVVQFTSLQEIMAGWLGLELGSYNHLSDSLHVYCPDLQKLEAVQVQPLPPNSDDLRFPMVQAESYLADLEAAADRMTDTRVTAGELVGQLCQSSLAPGYRNWLAILTADACRRRADGAAVADAVSACSNPCLRFMWQRWILRRRSHPPT